MVLARVPDEVSLIFNLHRAFTECASHLVQFGGHAYAAGLTINENSLDSFSERNKRGWAENFE